MILYKENLKRIHQAKTSKLIESEFSKGAGYKIKMQKSVVLHAPTMNNPERKWEHRSVVVSGHG